jgi:hypothetical protein
MADLLGTLDIGVPVFARHWFLFAFMQVMDFKEVLIIWKDAIEKMKEKKIEFHAILADYCLVAALFVTPRCRSKGQTEVTQTLQKLPGVTAENLINPQLIATAFPPKGQGKQRGPR